MTTYYVGSGGSDGANGTSWALRKLTLGGAEAIPVAAGDTVYVGAGTYRESLGCSVSGSAGNPITYIGDYLGTNTDGVGGVVRITGSDDDKTATRSTCITGTSRSYRTFTGFSMDTSTGSMIQPITACDNWIIQKCIVFSSPSGTAVSLPNPTNMTIQNCVIWGCGPSSGILFTNGSTTNNTNNLVSNCVLLGGGSGVTTTRVGGVTVKNSLFTGRPSNGVNVATALTVGQTITVNNCIFNGCANAIVVTATTEGNEDYNTFYGNNADRTGGVPASWTGAHSVTYPPLLDTRWFFNSVFGTQASKIVTPFDLASFSQLVNMAGTSPSATDLRGTGTIGAQREWGALEYDSNLKYKVSAYSPPAKNQQYSIRVALEDVSNPGSFKANPTLASGDFKVDIDGGGLTNLATLPTNSPAGSIWVVISLAASEMNGSVISVQAIDQTSPKEWTDMVFSIPTTSK